MVTDVKMEYFCFKSFYIKIVIQRAIEIHIIDLPQYINFKIAVSFIRVLKREIKK